MLYYLKINNNSKHLIIQVYQYNFFKVITPDMLSGEVY